MKVLLPQLAHTRSSVAGEDITLAVIGWGTEEHDILARELTAERVKAFFGSRAPGPVSRHELPGLGALTFILHGAAERGLSLRPDPAGTALAAVLLRIEVDLPLS